VNFKHPIFLALLSGLLFGLSWPETGGFTFLIFFSFLPLLYLEKQVEGTEAETTKNRFFKLFPYTYLAFFIWNLIATWWIKNASWGGAAMAIFFNSLFMAVVFQLFHRVKRRLNGRFAFLVLCSFWMAFEYLHQRWDLSWPWLTLGNVFAGSPWMIQWYEYTGVFGGTGWIFAVNFLVFSLLQKTVWQGRKSRRGAIAALSCVMLFPLLASFLLTFRILDFYKGGSQQVVIVQPNIDPYNEKFNGSFKEQLNKMLELAETQLDSFTSLVSFPETALTENLWENNLEKTYSVQALKAFQKRHPKLDILIGATSAYQYQPGETPSATARKFTDAEEYYDDFNTAIFLSGNDSVRKYHKSKFVPGVERMPFPAFFKPLEKLAINMGGTTGSLGEQPERTVFFSKSNSLKIAPVICYESVYGEFVNEYVLKGANIICIITNDGWWGDSPGYKQHLDYARLRAIETRRPVTRSANTGTSCFIDKWGAVSQRTPWWKPIAIKVNVHPNTELTFYVRHGDYIGRAAVFIAFCLLGYSFLLRFRRKEKP
jgi:apolipoprotein N-acyltransferase